MYWENQFLSFQTENSKILARIWQNGSNLLKWNHLSFNKHVKCTFFVKENQKISLFKKAKTFLSPSCVTYFNNRFTRLRAWIYEIFVRQLNETKWRWVQNIKKKRHQNIFKMCFRVFQDIMVLKCYVYKSFYQNKTAKIEPEKAFSNIF